MDEDDDDVAMTELALVASEIAHLSPTIKYLAHRASIQGRTSDFIPATVAT
jgi:hypothetical protein